MPVEPQVVNDIHRIADAVSSTPFWQSTAGGVILGSLLTLAIQWLLTEVQHSRQRRASAAGEVSSIRLQFTQLLPRLKSLRKGLEGGAEDNFEPITGWSSIYGNLLHFRAQQDQLVRDIDDFARKYPSLNASNRTQLVPNLLERLEKIISDCESLVDLRTDELLKRFERSIE